MKQKNYKRRWLLLTMGYVIFIFSNSMTPAVVSSSQSGFVLSTAREILSMVGLGDLGITEYFIRKLAHFTEYAGLGLLLCGTINAYGYPKKETVYLSVIFGILIPFADETIQLFVEGRSGQISDVWLDMAGVFFGFCICHLWRRIREGKQTDETDNQYKNQITV